MEERSREVAVSEAEGVSSVTARTKVGVFVQGNGKIFLRVKYRKFQVKL